MSVNKHRKVHYFTKTFLFQQPFEALWKEIRKRRRYNSRTHDLQGKIDVFHGLMLYSDVDMREIDLDPVKRPEKPKMTVPFEDDVIIQSFFKN